MISEAPKFGRPKLRPRDIAVYAAAKDKPSVFFNAGDKAREVLRLIYEPVTAKEPGAVSFSYRDIAQLSIFPPGTSWLSVARLERQTMENFRRALKM